MLTCHLNAVHPVVVTALSIESSLMGIFSLFYVDCVAVMKSQGELSDLDYLM